ncbi:MAG: hypothetical protein KKA07_08490 [Bacteroidetes bacterium]|nr:hypothetical protein [Bacteroidota bacterium]MBU1719099.1 hypothetical protein [Bacteroidota bacterium]
MSKTYKSVAEQIISEFDKEMHISEIAAKAHAYFPTFEIKKLENAINQAISNDIRNNRKSPFKRVTGKKGRNKKGCFQLKRKRKTPEERVARSVSTSTFVNREELGDVNDNFKGKAGEYAVISELLFRGYNAGMVAIDEGIDVIAFKDEKVFNIQVKTRTYKSSAVSFTIDYDKHKTNSELKVFYVVVIRYKPKRDQRVRSEFLVFHPRDIDNIFRDSIQKKEKLKFRISIEDGSFILNGQNVNSHLNDFILK